MPRCHWSKGFLRCPFDIHENEILTVEFPTIDGMDGPGWPAMLNGLTIKIPVKQSYDKQILLYRLVPFVSYEMVIHTLTSTQ